MTDSSSVAGAKAIRIAPNELHINETSLYKAIYKQSNPFPKHEQFYLGFATEAPTSFTEVDKAKHKERRRMLSSMFSRAGVLKLEDLIWERLKLLENKIDRLCDKDIDLYNAFRYVIPIDRSPFSVGPRNQTYLKLNPWQAVDNEHHFGILLWRQRWYDGARPKRLHLQISRGFYRWFGSRDYIPAISLDTCYSQQDAGRTIESPQPRSSRFSRSDRREFHCFQWAIRGQGDHKH